MTLQHPAPADEDRKGLAEEFLRLAQEDYLRSSARRAYFARLAREHGLTHSVIGSCLGMGEGGVRALLRRTEGQA